MKVLLDTCVWGGTRGDLEKAGHDVIWAGDWTEDPGDVEILSHAHLEKRILVTLDKDFSELAIVRGLPHSSIIRLVNLPAKQQVIYCLQILKTYGEELGSGAIITVDRHRVRIRL